MSLGFTYSSNTLMMHLNLVGADKMKSWYERFGLAKQVVCLMEKLQVILVGQMNYNKTSALVNPQLLPCSNDSSTIGFL